MQNVVLSDTDVDKLSEVEVKIFDKLLFCSEILRRWKSSDRIEKKILEQHAEWLGKDFVLIP